MTKKSNQETRASEKESQLSRTVDDVYKSVAEILNTARGTAYRAVNAAMVQAYWHIGRVIVEEEQKGKRRADYGRTPVEALAHRLTADFGKGFDKSNVWHMRNFYLKFPDILDALRRELTWTHYRLLLKVENEQARKFYEVETANSNWSTRELDRQINSLLYERLALSRDKEGALRLATEGQAVREPRDLIKDPFVLEFLGLPDDHKLLERGLEQSLLDKLQAFLLELGKGFAFIARQRRITLDGDHFYIDLVFYNFLLKCFFLLDLKIGKLTHGDIGQMDFYVRYFEQEVRGEGDNPTIGLILCSDKNEAMVKYTLLEQSERIFASRYKLYLPSEEELRRELSDERARIEAAAQMLSNDAGGTA